MMNKVEYNNNKFTHFYQAITNFRRSTRSGGGICLAAYVWWLMSVLRISAMQAGRSSLAIYTPLCTAATC